MMKSITAALLLSAATALPAHAACAFKNTVPLKTISAGFQAWKSVTSAMQECGNVQSDMDQNFQEKEPAALAANPALYQIAGVANETLVPLLNDGTIRPLDALIKKYGGQLQSNQLIKINGKTMAIAMDVNLENLMYRKDIFEKLNIAVPKNYDEVLDAAKKIQKSGLVQYPLGATYQSGWNIANEFVNLYLGFDGKLFGDHNEPAIKSEAGVKTLKMMKALSQYMDPEYLTADSTYVQRQLQEGKIAMSNLWASRAGAMENKQESQVVGKIGMAAAPSAYPGGKPATAVWWDGITIAKNITDEQADAAFRVAMEGIDTEMAKANSEDVIWLIKGYEPGPLAEGVAASADAGAPPYPASTAMGVMQTAIGNGVPDFMTGKKSAEATLASIEDDYRTGAKEKGLLQ
ncbi:ABC transporter substrate-binding protein [Pararhizobium mangrovi]|uniref:Extracellular solute-binding protein n=1 Tax=Pararhizobium mangrovi TaxID=2590452 RepID=A0A506U1K8_9HYPH|nr:extracellular solute-binding protein [Pararhizobium mangrovi]TPW27151.1 extracellular solute-binding protein [Pararhizobium mangrovi]